jgi:DNA-dependent RNA polymerase auxiliary subunit epsilon
MGNDKALTPRQRDKRHLFVEAAAATTAWTAAREARKSVREKAPFPVRFLIRRLTCNE